MSNLRKKRPPEVQPVVKFGSSRWAQSERQQQQELPPAEISASLRRRILDGYKSAVIQDGDISAFQQFTTGLHQAVQAEQHTKVWSESSTDRVRLAITEMVDRLMDVCLCYSDQFNEAFTTRFSISCSPPTFIREVSSYNSRREPVEGTSAYQGRISTGYSSLIFHGCQSTIRIYVIPASMALSFSSTDPKFDPIAELEPACRGTAVEWTLNGEPFRDDLVVPLCNNLHITLITGSINLKETC